MNAVSSSSSSSTFSTYLVNGIAVRVLDSTATAEISSLDLALAATPSGAFVKNNMNVDVSTANPTGYKLYMSSQYLDPSSNGGNSSNPTYTTALVNTEDSTYTIPSLSTNGVTEADFSRSGGSYVNRWGYSLDGDNSGTTSTNTYNAIPVHGTPTLIKTTSAQASQSLTNVTIAVNADLSKAAGTYKNTLVFSAIANPVPTAYTLSFNLDGGSAPTSDPDAFDTMTASEVASSHTFTIPSTVPEKSGYSFQYWTDSSSNQYNPGDTITVIGNEEYIGQETLTANYIEATPASGCAAASVGDTYVADGVTYIKLADNNCYTKDSQGYTVWTNAPSLCPTGTHLPSEDELVTLIGNYSGGGLYNATGWSNAYWSNTTYPGFNSYAYTFMPYSGGVDLGGNLKTNSYHVVCMADKTTIATATYLQDVESCPTTLTTGTQYTLTDKGEPEKTYTVSKLADNKCWMTENYNVSGGKTLTSEYYNVPASNCDITGDGTCTLPASSTTGFSDNSTAYVYNDSTYGGYYSWKAATAGTNPSSGDASNDICPRNWRLPTRAEFNALISAYSASSAGSKLTQSPVNMKYSGYYNNSSINYQGSGGYYWSSSAFSSTAAVGINLTSSADVYNDYKRYGYPLRCIFGD